MTTAPAISSATHSATSIETRARCTRTARAETRRPSCRWRPGPTIPGRASRACAGTADGGDGGEHRDHRAERLHPPIDRHLAQRSRNRRIDRQQRRHGGRAPAAGRESGRRCRRSAARPDASAAHHDSRRQVRVATTTRPNGRRPAPTSGWRCSRMRSAARSPWPPSASAAAPASIRTATRATSSAPSVQSAWVRGNSCAS